MKNIETVTVGFFADCFETSARAIGIRVIKIHIFLQSPSPVHLGIHTEGTCRIIPSLMAQFHPFSFHRWSGYLMGPFKTAFHGKTTRSLIILSMGP